MKNWMIISILGIFLATAGIMFVTAHAGATTENKDTNSPETYEQGNCPYASSTTEGCTAENNCKLDSCKAQLNQESGCGCGR